MNRWLTLFLLVTLWGLFPAPRAQEKPIERTFTAGVTLRYRVRLAVRSELEGQRPTNIGVSTYAEPFAHAAEAGLSWRATRLIVSVAPDGSAEIEETLDEFKRGENVTPKTPEGEALQAALNDALATWTKLPTLTLRYRETSAGQITGLTQEGAPVFDQEPPLLTLWLLRAMRPTVALPTRPFHAGERWQEPRAAQVPPWQDVRGTETGEWLEAPGPQAGTAGARLHVIQQISGLMPVLPFGGEASADKPAMPAEGRFHAESLATIAYTGLADAYGGVGNLMDATRSASREIVRALPAAPGLPEPPRFRARVSAQIQIEFLP